MANENLYKHLIDYEFEVGDYLHKKNVSEDIISKIGILPGKKIAGVRDPNYFHKLCQSLSIKELEISPEGYVRFYQRIYYWGTDLKEDNWAFSLYLNLEQTAEFIKKHDHIYNFVNI